MLLRGIEHSQLKRILYGVSPVEWHVAVHRVKRAAGR